MIAGLLTGWGVAAFFFFNPALKPFGMHEGILGLLIHIPVLVAVSLATRAQDAEHVESFCGSVASHAE